MQMETIVHLVLPSYCPSGLPVIPNRFQWNLLTALDYYATIFTVQRLKRSDIFD